MSEKYEKYEYQVEEKSLSQKYLLKLFWLPIVNKLPATLKPNTITIFGFCFMLLSILFVWIGHNGYNFGFILAGISVFLYMACDNVDGIHARRTKQSSKLGEFLDHWLDSMNAVILNMTIVYSLFLNGWLLIVCMTLVILSFFATIWEHHHTGVFYSGAMGTNEGLLFVITLFFLLFFFFKDSFFKYDGPEIINIATLMAYLTIISCIVTLVMILKRMKSKFADFIPIVTAIIAISLWTFLGNLNTLLAAGLILIINIPFCSQFLLQRLTAFKLGYRNQITVIIALLSILALLFNRFVPSNVFQYMLAGLIFLIFLTMILDLRYALKFFKNQKT